jgi:DNA-binding response OmpR family regulator
VDHSEIEIKWFSDGIRALLGFSSASPSAVFVPTDVIGVNLLGVVEAVARERHVPVIVGFTPQDDASASSAFAALEAGACALLALPFECEALATTMRAIDRRGIRRRSPLEYGVIRLFPEEHEVYVGGSPVQLSPKEFRTTEHLLSKAPGVLTSHEIASILEQDERAYNSLRVRKHMQRLRRKLDAAVRGPNSLLATLKGVGYRLTDKARGA